MPIVDFSDDTYTLKPGRLARDVLIPLFETDDSDDTTVRVDHLFKVDHPNKITVEIENDGDTSTGNAFGVRIYGRIEPWSGTMEQLLNELHQGKTEDPDNGNCVIDDIITTSESTGLDDQEFVELTSYLSETSASVTTTTSIVKSTTRAAGIDALGNADRFIGPSLYVPRKRRIHWSTELPLEYLAVVCLTINDTVANKIQGNGYVRLT